MDKVAPLMPGDHASPSSSSSQMIIEEDSTYGPGSEQRQEAYKLCNGISSSSSNNCEFKTVFRTNARLEWGGRVYKICIECDSRTTRGWEGWEMVIKVGTRVAVRVKHLAWNFRGKSTFHVDYSPHRVYFDVLWDAHDWLYNDGGTATFLFKKVKDTSSPPHAYANLNPSYSPSDILVHAWKFS